MDEVEKNKEDPVNKEDQNYNQVFIKEEKLNKRCIDENFAFVTADDENDDDSDDNELANFDPKKKYICSFKDCNAQFLRPSRLLRHERQHTGERPYKCKYEDCDKAYTNSSHLKRHITTHSNSKQTFDCPHCPKKLSFLHNLKRHCERMHSENTDKLVCKDCGKRFKKIHPYKEHLAAHANSTITYQCMHCTLSFTCHSKLVRHIKSHNNDSFCCKLCSTKFVAEDDFTEHLKSTHPDDHMCKVCDIFFTKKRSLQVHKLSHEKSTILTCHYENCFRSYYFKRNLNTHIKVFHLGQKFTCELCNRKFTTKKKLKGHVLTHMSLNGTKKEEKVTRSQKQRKDKGVPTKSMVSRLIGIQFPREVEKTILNRKTRIELENDSK